MLASVSDMYLGPSLAGYAIGDLSSPAPEIYVWSMNGKQTLHFISSKPIKVWRVGGEETLIKPKKDRLEITVGEEPVVAKGLSIAQFVPIEVVDAAIKEAETAIAAATKKFGDVSIYQYQVDRAKEMYRRGMMGTSLDMARVTASQIEGLLKGSKAGKGG